MPEYSPAEKTTESQAKDKRESWQKGVWVGSEIARCRALRSLLERSASTAGDMERCFRRIETAQAHVAQMSPSTQLPSPNQLRPHTPQKETSTRAKGTSHGTVSLVPAPSENARPSARKTHSSRPAARRRPQWEIVWPIHAPGISEQRCDRDRPTSLGGKRGSSPPRAAAQEQARRTSARRGREGQSATYSRVL